MTKPRADFVFEKRLFGFGEFIDRLATLLPLKSNGLFEDGIGFVGYAHLENEVFVETVDFGSVVVTDCAECKEVLGGVSCRSVAICARQSPVEDPMVFGALGSFEAHCVEHTSAVLGTDSQKISTLISPRVVCSVTDIFLQLPVRI